MTNLTMISQSIYGIQRYLNDSGLPLKVGHVRELLAASLGFKSFASLKNAWKQEFEEGDFQEALFVLDQQTFDHRALKLGHNANAELNDAFLQGIQLEWRDRFTPDLIIEWEVGEALNQVPDICEYPLDDHFSGEIASSNAIMDDEEIDPFTALLPSGPLSNFVDLGIGYSANMEALDDKPFTTFMENYSKDGMSGQLTAQFSTIGFRGLIFMGFEGGNTY
ncbi:hypothetical protein LG290_06395 [Halomonas sediminis]